MGLAERVERLVTAHESGHDLAGEFYLDEELFALELEAIWAREWLYVAPSADLDSPGAFVTAELFGNPIVVVRDRTGAARSFHNVCRHRGSLIVTARSGHLEQLVCPYHRWTYDLDGRVLATPGFDRTLERARYGLAELAVTEVAGLVFVRLAGGRSPEPMREAFARAGSRHGLDAARVAARRSYLVHANWKLVIENNRECLHCAANHPEYVEANFDRYSADEACHHGLEEALSRHAAALGSDEAFLASGGLFAFPDASGAPFSANRTALRATHRTESLDGHLVAPPMGDLGGADIATLRLRALPNFWCHASVDYAAITRLVPCAVDETMVEVAWLVDAGAEEGRDFDEERLVAFWARTSEQDWRIVEAQQIGVRSRAYRAGPLAPGEEANLAALVQWYLEAMRAAAPIAAH